MSEYVFNSVLVHWLWKTDIFHSTLVYLLEQLLLHGFLGLV